MLYHQTWITLFLLPLSVFLQAYSDPPPGRLATMAILWSIFLISLYWHYSPVTVAERKYLYKNFCCDRTPFCYTGTRLSFLFYFLIVLHFISLLHHSILSFSYLSLRSLFVYFFLLQSLAIVFCFFSFILISSLLFLSLLFSVFLYFHQVFFFFSPSFSDFLLTASHLLPLTSLSFSPFPSWSSSSILSIRLFYYSSPSSPFLPQLFVSFTSHSILFWCLRLSDLRLESLSHCCVYLLYRPE